MPSKSCHKTQGTSPSTCSTREDKIPPAPAPAVALPASLVERPHLESQISLSINTLALITLTVHRLSRIFYVFAQGAHVFRQLPTLSSNITDANGKDGWTCNLFKTGTDELAGQLDDIKASEISMLAHEVVNKDLKLEATYTALRRRPSLG